MNTKRKISMMDPGPPPKSPKSKGMAYLEPTTVRVTSRKRVSKEIAELESVEKVKSDVQRFNRNKVRLFDLIVRIEDMQRRNVARTRNLRYAIVADLQPFEFTRKGPMPGVKFHYETFCAQDFEPERWNEESESIRVDNEESDEYKFENVVEALDKLEANHEAELAKARKRDAVLRAMSAEDRAAIGMEGWKDPDPDGEAKFLAARVIAVKTRRRK
jgi:hypothetical protein